MLALFALNQTRRRNSIFVPSFFCSYGQCVTSACCRKRRDRERFQSIPLFLNTKKKCS